ncbi:MAG: neutral/alkaline non-lysosomal ceramidase N-terminal domain-containing protein [Candidatus Hydrogenedentes bacterium]|nr:neutral/alkaline non-lysosomal ceramidase N-terminal domain-containing protein [Candidatus Hydrogenedentota bacterium]
MKIAFISPVLLLLLSILTAGGAYGEAVPLETPWKAGVARVDITPQKPLWLAGYASRDHAAEGTLHSLWAKALTLEDASGNCAVLITSDVLGFPKGISDRICDRIAVTYGFTRSQIILNASHTHSAPVIDNSLRCIYTYDDAEEEKLMHYATVLEDSIVALVGAARENLHPAAIFSKNGIARIAVNRRNNTERELLSTSTLAGPYDHAVPTLKIIHADGTLAAVVFGYACHPTVLSGYSWCGDYPGFAQIALEENHPGATALFFAGCGADQNPLPRRTIALAQQYGQTLAASVDRVLSEAMRPLAAQLSTAYAEIALELEEAPDAATLRERVANTSGYAHQCNQALLDRIDGGETLPGSYPYPLQLWQMGEQTLVTLGGEVTIPYAIGIKERLGQDTFVMGYSNDLMAYIPSEQILEEGGYEGDTSQLIYGMPNKWKPGLEAQILDAVEALHKTLR